MWTQPDTQLPVVSVQLPANSGAVCRSCKSALTLFRLLLSFYVLLLIARVQAEHTWLYLHPVGRINLPSSRIVVICTFGVSSASTHYFSAAVALHFQAGSFPGRDMYTQPTTETLQVRTQESWKHDALGFLYWPGVMVMIYCDPHVAPQHVDQYKQTKCMIFLYLVCIKGLL